MPVDSLVPESKWRCESVKVRTHSSLDLRGSLYLGRGWDTDVPRHTDIKSRIRKDSDSEGAYTESHLYYDSHSLLLTRGPPYKLGQCTDTSRYFIKNVGAKRFICYSVISFDRFVDLGFSLTIHLKARKCLAQNVSVFT
jgi:hypothetical protein